MTIHNLRILIITQIRAMADTVEPLQQWMVSGHRLTFQLNNFPGNFLKTPTIVINPNSAELLCSSALSQLWTLS